MSRKLTNEEFIEKAKEVHGDKYNYSKVKYIDSSVKVEIICKDHDSFWQRACSHLSGQKCFKCTHNDKKLTKQEFINRSNKIHENRYNYSKVNYINSKTKVEIICEDHGSFWQTPNSHLHGNKCFDCACNIQKLTKQEFINQTKEAHGDKYNYSKVNYINSCTNVEIICKNHGSFWQRPDNHLNGHNCPKCKYNISKKEIEWLNFLQVQNDFRHKTITINDKKYYLDALDPINKIIWEFYGDYWHGNLKIYNPTNTNPTNKKTYGELYANTIRRENELKSAGYTIISIFESDWNKIVKQDKKKKQRTRKCLKK